MVKKIINVTMHARASSYTEDDSGFEYVAFHHDDMSSCGYVACDTREVTFDVPPRDVIINGLVAAYRAEQQRIRADAQSKVSQIDEAIQKMLCLENKQEKAEE